MKNYFDSADKQAQYINKFIYRNTDISKVCQYCGDKGHIHNNYLGNPWEIQIICRKCNKEHKVKPYNMQKDIPLISVKEHVTKPKYAKDILDQELISKLEYILGGNVVLPKYKMTKYLGLTEPSFDRIVSEYEKLYHKDIQGKLKEIYKKGTSNKLVEAKTKNKNNLIYKYKTEKGFSNRTLSARCKELGYTVTATTISKVSTSTDTTKIRYLTKCGIAEALDIDLSTLFKEDKIYKKVKTYNDLLEFNKQVRLRLVKVMNQHNITYIDFSKMCNINYNVLYAFMCGETPYAENIEKIIKITNSLDK